MQSATRFLERRVPMSKDSENSLVFEMALPTADAGTWVVLREARRSAERTPVLTACFEHISNFLWVELFSLRKLAQPARFFQCRYELKPGGGVGWTLREVKLAQSAFGFRQASWAHVDEPTLTSISESLNLSESPAKLT